MLSGRGVNGKPFPVMRARGHHKPLTSSVPITITIPMLKPEN